MYAYILDVARPPFRGLTIEGEQGRVVRLTHRREKSLTGLGIVAEEGGFGQEDVQVAGQLQGDLMLPLVGNVASVDGLQEEPSLLDQQSVVLDSELVVGLFAVLLGPAQRAGWLALERVELHQVPS